MISEFMKKVVHAVDLFAGAGGTSTGLVKALISRILEVGQ